MGSVKLPSAHLLTFCVRVVAATLFVLVGYLVGTHESLLWNIGTLPLLAAGWSLIDLECWLLDRRVGS